MRKRKPRAYLEKWKFYYNKKVILVNWYAFDAYGNYIANKKTKKECEVICREKGYVPKKRYGKEYNEEMEKISKVHRAEHVGRRVI